LTTGEWACRDESFVHRVFAELDSFHAMNFTGLGRVQATPVQAAVDSIHLYGRFLFVLRLDAEQRRKQLVSATRGSVWIR
jgi:hypothetical protein